MSKILAIEMNGETTDRSFTTKNVWNSWEGVIFHTELPKNILQNDAFPEERNNRISLLLSNDTTCCETFGVRLLNEESEITLDDLKKYIGCEIIDITRSRITSEGITAYGMPEISDSYVVHINFTNQCTLNIEFYNFHNGGYKHTVKFVLQKEIVQERF